ncbi:MAG: M56 family metallopeptidase [Solirubrobacteraceae bacterium]
MRSARRFYRLSVALGVAGAGVLGVAVAFAVRSIDLGAPSLARLLRGCREVVLSRATVTSVVVLVLTGVGVVVASLALRSLLSHCRAQRRVLSGLSIQREIAHRGIAVRVFAHERPKAFCAGLLRPRIYLSTAALDGVPAAELAAVLEHECHHSARRDPLRLLIVQVFADALFFLPLMRRMRERYCALSELAADEAAISGTGERHALAAALITFAGTRSAGVVGIAPERVDHLLGEHPRWRLSITHLASALATLAGLLAVAATLAAAATPGHLSVIVLGAQACMIAMALAPMLLSACLIVITRRSWQSAARA